MSESQRRRNRFATWVDKNKLATTNRLPITHITKGPTAYDIIDSGKIVPTDCEVFGKAISYYFYGRPAYRVQSNATIKLEASCPFCFILDGSAIDQASDLFPFDTGAFAKRMFNHIIDDDFKVQDFNMSGDADRPEKLIHAVYKSRTDYVQGNRQQMNPIEQVAAAYELEARSYLELIASKGRNEPDDRVATIEIQLQEVLEIANAIIGIIVPHTQWLDSDRSPHLCGLQDKGVDILTYEFIPGRPLEHYQVGLELVMRDYLKKKGYV